MFSLERQFPWSLWNSRIKIPFTDGSREADEDSIRYAHGTTEMTAKNSTTSAQFCR